MSAIVRSVKERVHVEENTHKEDAYDEYYEEMLGDIEDLDVGDE